MLWSGYEFNRRAPSSLARKSGYKLLLLLRDAEKDALRLYQIPMGYDTENKGPKEFLKMIALVLLGAHEFSKALLSSPQRFLELFMFYIQFQNAEKLDSSMVKIVIYTFRGLASSFNKV
jgi:hypothetical protein